MSLLQLQGMMWYEMRMLWRRRALPLVLVGTFLLMVIVAQQALDAVRLYPDSPSFQEAVAMTGIAPETLHLLNTTYYVMLMTWPIVMIALVVGVPIIMAETIPIDRQLGVRELLDSLPMSRATYLSGKLLGVWTSLLAGLALVAVLGGLAHRLRFGPFQWEGYLLIWAYLLPTAFLMPALAVLLAAGQPNRRRAAGLGVLLMIATLLLPTLVAGIGEGTWLEYLVPFDPIRMLDIQMDYMAQRAPSLVPPVRIEQVRPLQPWPVVAAIAAAKVALVWVALWGWMRWSEGR